MRELTKVSHLTEQSGSGFWFFRELEGEASFKLDCDLIDGGLMTSREGEYYSFLGHLIEHLTLNFGAIEIGPEGSIPSNKDT